MNIGEGQTYKTDDVSAGKNSNAKEPVITVEPGADYIGPSNEYVNNTDTDRMPLSESIIAVYTELPISGEAYIAGSQLVIPEGKTLRIMSGGNLDMARNTLIVEGTLIIVGGATGSNGGSLVLVRGGTVYPSGTG